MVYIDDDTKEKIKKLKSKAKSVYFLVDFDNVITDNNSSDTWCTIIENVNLKKKCIKKRQELEFKCKEIELNNTIEYEKKCELTKEVWKECLNLMRELNLDEKKIKYIVNNKSNLKVRSGAKNFLKVAYEKHIPVIIISDGIFEVIKCLLEENDCYYDNIMLVSNKLLDVNSDLIIHSLNKNELSIPEEVKSKIIDRKISVLLASTTNDINMLSKSKLNDSIKVAFLDRNINENFDIFLNYFNIIFTHNSSFEQISDKLAQI